MQRRFLVGLLAFSDWIWGDHVILHCFITCNTVHGAERTLLVICTRTEIDRFIWKVGNDMICRVLSGTSQEDVGWY